MARQVFDNKDLVDLIYGFGPGHRDQMKVVYDSLKKSTTWLLSPVPNAMKHHPCYPEVVEFFLQKRCHCCSRHCHNKPNILLEKGILVYHYGNGLRVPESRDRFDCDCDCRHACRKIIETLLFYHEN
jgi:hypothetical protein